MKPGQNPLVALTALEEMASQLSQQNLSKAPNQSLIQFLSILPESEYEVEKRTFCNGLQPDREQVLMAIRSRYENFQRQRKKGGGRKDAGNAFVADAGGRHGGKNHSSSSARGRGKGREGRGRGGRTKPNDGEDDSKRWPAAGIVGVSLTRKKGATRSVSVAALRDINPSAALIRSAACVVVKAIRLRSAPTLSLF